MSEIRHVSDTALLVAACRAVESDAPDGFISDPFAKRLAGEQGMAIYRALPQAEMRRFGMGVRTRFFEELLLEALASEPIATVLSVGCGLDTRPWRMDLPNDLRWIEIDFAEMLDYKDALMRDEIPRCRRERLSADLNDPEQRRMIYAATGLEPALMITEGVLMYLPAATVGALAEESWRESGIRHWMADIDSAAFVKALHLDRSAIQSVQAQDSLRGEQVLECLTRHGWTTAARRSYLTDMGFAMDRIRIMMGDRQPESPLRPDDPTGVHRFSHTA